MRIGYLCRVQFLFLSASVLIACGNMDTMISPSSSYKVGALVNEKDLSELAVVGSSNVIRPQYASESARDPDVVALRVVLRNDKGDQAAEPVEYRERGSTRAASPAQSQSGIVLVDSLSSTLPTFSLPEKLAVGRYTLVFQVVGRDGVLYEEKRSFYYIADKTFALTGFASYPPGTGPTSDAPLFPTKVPLLLEATIDAAAGLDPYLVWSYGGKRIATTRVADAGTRLLWTPPGSAGFYRVDVSLYPAEPRSGELSGVTRSITVATSPTAPYPGLPKADNEYLSIFRFLGDLTDRGSAASSGKPLEAETSRANLWLPFATGYGLAVGPLRSYKAAMPAVHVESGVVQHGRVILQASVRKAGLLWKAVFDGAAGTGSNLELALESTSSGPTLTVRSNGKSKSLQHEMVHPYGDDAQLFEIEFVVSEETEGALLIRFFVDGKKAGEIETAVLSLLLSSGRFSLGGSPDAKSAASAANTVTAVIDELALYVEKPEEAVQSPQNADIAENDN